MTSIVKIAIVLSVLTVFVYTAWTPEFLPNSSLETI